MTVEEWVRAAINRMGANDMLKVTRENNFFYFTLSLILLLLVSSAGADVSYSVNRYLTDAIRLLVVGVAFSVLHFGRGWRIFAGVTIAAMLVVNTAQAWLPYWPREFLRGLISLLFFSVALYYAGRRVLTSGEVSANTMVGALAVYLLLGIVWAGLYTMVLLFQPHAFNGIEVAVGKSHFGQVLYFSYVTLATLGYGDITPAIPVVRTLAYLEAIFGTFYLALVVASLVSARSSQHHE